MGIKKSIKKIVDSFIPKDKPTPMSGGNSYETAVALEVQKQLDLQTLEVNQRAIANNAVLNKIMELTNKFVNDRNINEYVLLNYQANYFCGTCKFKTSDHNLRRMVLNVIRGAFLFGAAGILVENNKLSPYYVTNMEYDTNGNLVSCRVFELELMLSNINKLQREPDLNKIAYRTLDKKECDNLAVFQWGVMGFSAWMTIWPFVQFQHSLLKMVIIQSFTYNKKFIYNTNNINAITDEMAAFFDPTNPFIINIGVTLNKELPNRFTTEDLAAGFDNNSVIQYYNEAINIYYHILGRRVNNDYKKERNITTEVESTQENYDIVQSDWLNYFEIFIEKLASLISIDIEVVKEKEGDLSEQFKDDYNDNQD